MNIRGAFILLLIALIISISLMLRAVAASDEMPEQPPIESCDKWEVAANGNVIVTCTVPKMGWVQWMHPATIQPPGTKPDKRRFVKSAVQAGGSVVVYGVNREPSYYRECGRQWRNAVTKSWPGDPESRKDCICKRPPWLPCRPKDRVCY